MAVDYAGARSERRARVRRRLRTQELSLLRRMDWILFGAVLALVAYGLTVINGVTQHDIDGSPHYFLVRQGVFAAAGSLGLFAALLVDPSVYRRFWRTFYV